MSKEIIMAGEGSVPTEQGAAAPPPAGEISPEDTNRLQRAETTLGIPLTEEQRKAILEAHQVGAGELGKDQTPAGIGNYTIHQLGEKIEILKEAGFTKEQWKVLLREGITGLDVPDYLKEAKEAKRTESRFEELRKWVEDYDEKNIDIAGLTLDQKDEYRRNLEENLLEMGELINEAGASGVLSFVMEEAQQVFARIVPAPAPRRRRQSMYSDSNPESPPKTPEEQIAYVSSILADYQETFWEYDDAVLAARFGTTDISGMKEAYQGVSKYVASKMATAIMKELKGIPLDPAGEIGDFFLEEIQRRFSEKTAEAERQRRRQRRNATAKEILPYNTWREKFEFDWAENREELKMSVFVWLGKFIAHLPEATIDELHKEANTWKGNAISSLEKAANDLGISEGEPFYKELKSTIEAYVSVLGGVKFLETEGGFEAYTTYLEEFAHNFNDKHDAIYLGNKKSAIIQAFLARNHGEIALGTPEHNVDIEKPKEGDLTKFRENIEERALRYAATHELYIRDGDFKKAVEATAADQARIINEVALLNLPVEEANAEIRKRIGEINRRYGWDDEIEKLLLTGGDRDKALAAGDLQALMRMDIRSNVFVEIKERLDKEDRLAGLSEDERKDAIRNRIKDKIKLAGKEQLLDEISRMATAEADVALWRYVRDFNKKLESQGHRLWFPSAWDMARLSIDTPTKLIDRALSEDQFDAMVEEVGLFKGVIGIGTTGVSVELQIDGLTEEEIREKISDLSDLNTTQRKELLEDALFNKQQRDFEAEGAFNINRNYQKFLGIDARWGGLVTREVIDSGVTELRTISSLAEEILGDKIKLEEDEIEKEVTKHKEALIAAGGLSGEEIAEAVIWKRRLLRRDATFGVTLALRELGVANGLANWNYDFFNDPKLVGEIAPYLGYRHGDKPKIADLIDQGRRETRAVFDYLADTHMDERILVVRDEPNLELDEHGQPKAHHEEAWDRKRVINDAGEMVLRDIFESRFMRSTSGGVEVPGLISKIGDLGVYDLLWEMGCKDFREFQGFIKRRDEYELARQSLWNIKKWKDPISYAKRLREAGAAQVFLVGGNTKEGYVHGVLIEPLSGAYKDRDIFFDKNTWLGTGMGADTDKMKQAIRGHTAFSDEMRILLEKDAAIKSIDPVVLDRLVEIGAGIMKPLLDYLDHQRYVMNRGGRAPSNWKLNNELIVKAYINEMSDESVYGDYHLAYAPQGRSSVARKIFMAILRASSYHLLSEKEYDDLGLDKVEVKSRLMGKETYYDKTLIPRKIKAAKEKIAAKRQEIEARDLPDSVKRKMDARRDYLIALNTHEATHPLYPGKPNLELEVERIKDDYIEDRLHREVVGEWPASFDPLEIAA